MRNQGGWIRSAEVIPGLNNALRPFGSFVGTSFRSVKGWTVDGKREFDYGAIILPPSSRPGDRTGYFGYAVRDDAYLSASVLNLSGYPGDKNNGNEQWFMSLRPKSLSSRVITYNIDTMGGQSGAPVWVKVGTQRYCVGIHTNGHLSGNSATRIVKPVFDNIKNWKSLGL
jgi:V8-like Glu-specific endopeptidase